MSEVAITLSIFFTLSTIAFGGNLLDRSSWNFSKTEQETIVNLELSGLQELLTSSLKNSSDYEAFSLRNNLIYGKLSNAEITDLNNDNVCELVLKVDVSGRGVFSDTTILSRSADKITISCFPDYGPDIELWNTGEENVLVGSAPIQSDIARSDPSVTFPSLYEWSDNGCRDVSASYPAFYETVFLSNLNAFTEYYSSLSVDNLPKDEKERINIEAKGWSLALKKALKIHPNLISNPPKSAAENKANHQNTITNNTIHTYQKSGEARKNISHEKVSPPSKTITPKTRNRIVLPTLLCILVPLVTYFLRKNYTN